ncbi:MAG: nicotinate-nucleotide diphosphorylase (carboxylating), partial [Deltaproteobacteria bacterium]|nr:nicotinate-nucleotide diphosphorylase (carboxylating) [Deltaproteobacteria bacterium]
MDVLITLQIEQLLKNALEEDIGAGDLTTLSTVPSEARGVGRFRAKRDCVVAGLIVLDKIFSLLDPAVNVRRLRRD